MQGIGKREALITIGHHGEGCNVAENALDRVRQLCLALRETTERLSHGEPTWFVRDKKVFVMYSDHHHGGDLGMWCAAPFGMQEELVASDPGRFFVPPYVGHRGWIGVRLDDVADWDEIADIVEDAYRMIAPAKLRQELDARNQID